jgi:uncharacterized repeat protein (TIGR02543 family)
MGDTSILSDTGIAVSCPVAVTGQIPMLYQWYKGAAVADGKTDKDFAILALTQSDTGVYFCVASNPYGKDTSRIFRIKVRQHLGGIKGFVVSSKNVERLSNVVVTLSPGDVKAATTAEGIFEFTRLRAGTYAIAINPNGYDPFSNNAIEVNDSSMKDLGIIALVPADTAGATLKVVYDGNGAGAGSVPVDQKTYKPGMKVMVLGNTGNLAKTGAVFGGWNTKSDGSGTSYVAGDTFTMGAASGTLFAKWKPAAVLTLTYDGNGKTGGSAPLDTNKYSAGDSVTVLGNTGNLTRTGYFFNSWNTNANGSGTAFAAGSKFPMPATSATLFAIWSTVPTICITFNDQAATTPVSPATKIVLSPATTVGSLPAEPKKTGYTFGGWFTEPNGGGAVFTATTTVTASDTVYAKWNGATATITISKQPASKTVCAGVQATFSVKASGAAALTYQWRKGASAFTDIPGAVDTVCSLTPAASDSGTILSCLVSGEGASSAASALCTLHVNSPSTAATGVTAAATSVCSGDSTTLSVAGGQLGASASWKWYTDAGCTKSAGSGPSITVKPTAATTYYVRAEGPCGPTTAASQAIAVNTPSKAPTSITASAATACAGSAITLTPTGGTLGTGASWKWFTDAACTQAASGTPNADGSQISVTPSSNTTYYVQAVGPCNTTTAVSKAITVSTPSTPPTGITSSATGVCPGGSLTLTVSGGSLGTGASWKWYTNSTCTQAASGTPGSSGSQFTVTPTSQTVYYVRAEGGSCNPTPAASTTISVNTPPKITSTLSNQDVCETGMYASFSIAATGAMPLSYDWCKSDGTVLGHEAGYGVSTATVGSTSIYCVVKDANGCSTRSNTATVTVHQATVFTRQPEDQGGYQVTVRNDSVNATGEGTLTYQWQYQLPDKSWGVLGTGKTVSVLPYTLKGYESYVDTYVTTNIPVRVRITNSFGCEIFSKTVEYGVSWGI